jgi:hypothetical protein
MDHTELSRKARDAFHDDLATPPPLTLRGANAVDSYDRPEPFDERLDEATDAYLEGFAFWAMPYLDARSWRHYLPRFIEYAVDHRDDPTMVVEATVRSLRPPDRVPARLTTLSAEQEAVVVAFLEWLALGDGGDADDDAGSTRHEARTALEEWWLPGAYLRGAAEAGRRARTPTNYMEVGGGQYRLALPDTLEGGGVHHVESEHRTVEVWRGPVCGDALADVFVNVYALTHRTWGEAEEGAAKWLAPEARHWIDVPGARKAVRLDGTTYRYSPAEPERTTMVIALGVEEIVTLTVRGTQRADVEAELDRVIRSFALVSPTRG